MHQHQQIKAATTIRGALVANKATIVLIARKAVTVMASSVGKSHVFAYLVVRMHPQ